MRKKPLLEPTIMQKIDRLKRPVVRFNMCERCDRVGTKTTLKRKHIKLAKRYLYECRFGCLK